MPPILLDGGPLPTRLVPPPPPTPPQYTVKPGDTLPAVAASHHLSPQELATFNRIAPDAALSPGQVLQLPANAVLSTEERDQAAPKTPQEKTDAAYDQYLQAQYSLQGDQRSQAGHADIPQAQSALAQAKNDFDQAVQAEIGGQVAQANQGVPGPYRTPESQLIDQYGAQIKQRYAGDPAAQSEIQSAIGDYQVQRQADNLIPGYYGDWSAADKLKGIDLDGQPPAVVAKVLADPRVQQWITQAAADIGKPYGSESGNDAQEDVQAANNASTSLSDLVTGLPPDLARVVVKQCMPTIQKIAGADANSSGWAPFENLSRVVGALGSGPDAQQLTTDIAKAFGNQFKTWQNRFEDPRMGSIEGTVAGGTSPALALEMAHQLQQQGDAQDAGAILNDVEKGVEGLQATTKGDVENYAKLTADLNWAVKNLGPNLTQDQLNQAIQNWINQQPQEWKDKFQAAQQKMVTDGQALIQDLGAMNSLPPGLAGTAPGVLDALKQSIGNDDDTQTALKFAMSKDQTLFAGQGGEAAASFLTEACAKSKEFIAQLGPAYVSSQVLPAISSLNANDPASVQKAYQTLEDFRGKAAAMLGIPQSEVNEGIDNLKDLISDSKSASPAGTIDDKALAGVQKKLGELKEMSFSSGAAGTIFRTLGLGIAGASLMNYTGKSIDDPKISNLLNTMAATVGLAKDAGSFATTVSLVDADSSLGEWANATSVAGQVTEKFIGVLSAGAFVAGVFESVGDDNAAGAVFNGIGVAGTLLSTFGEAAGLGSWAGPVGVGVAFVAAAGLSLVEYREQVNQNTEIAENFFKDAGIDEAPAKAMASEAAKQTEEVRQGFNLSPIQLQDLATAHPELFDVNPSQTQAVIDAAKACGIQPQDVGSFVDALSKGQPQYLQLFGAQDMGGTSGQHPLTYAAQLFSTVDNIPGMHSYLQAHAPDSVGPAADARRMADQQYESALSGMDSQELIANLLAGNSNPAYQAEIINVMKNQHSLDFFVQQMSTNYAFNKSWPQATRSAVLAAQGAGVLSAEQAQTYLDELGGS